MLSSVLRSKWAVKVNIEIMRAFVQLRQLLSTHEALRKKIEAMERKYDDQFLGVFDAINALTDARAKRRIDVALQRSFILLVVQEGFKQSINSILTNRETRANQADLICRIQQLPIEFPL
jgi:hypothetical protein